MAVKNRVQDVIYRITMKDELTPKLKGAIKAADELSRKLKKLGIKISTK